MRNGIHGKWPNRPQFIGDARHLFFFAAFLSPVNLHWFKVVRSALEDMIDKGTGRKAKIERGLANGPQLE